MKLHKLPNGRQVALLENDTHICPWIIQEGRLDHDRNCLPLLDPYIHKGFTVLDVGSFVGDHTEYYVNRVGREGEVYAFEPNDRAFDCLAYNMEQYKNVACIPFGISDSEHKIGISQSDNVGASHAIDGDSIQCITIDSLNARQCHFIKMDCEGMELRALKGAEKTIANFRPTMLLEINRGALERQGTSADEVFAWLNEHGYTYRNIYVEQGLEDDQLDILCLPK